MGFFVWKDLFSVNNEEMDRQHKLFFDYLNQMFEAVEKMNKKAIIEQMLNNLKDYAYRHFEDEEILLEGVGYPELNTQRREHAVFSSYIDKLLQSCGNQEVAIPESTLAFMKDWFLDHILQQDRKYGVYLIERR